MSLQQLYASFDKCPNTVHEPHSLTGKADRDFGSTAKRLEHLSRIIQYNHKDLAHSTMWDSVSSNIRAWNDMLPVACTRDELASNIETNHMCQPDYHTEIINVSSSIDEVHGRATVFLHLMVLGLSCGHTREAIASFHWERRQGQWLCIKLVAFRGPAGFS